MVGMCWLKYPSAIMMKKMLYLRAVLLKMYAELLERTPISSLDVLNQPPFEILRSKPSLCRAS